MAAKLAKTIAATSGVTKDLKIDPQEGNAQNEAAHSKMRKTKYCSYFLQGACRFGSDCMFAHSLEEIHQAPDLRKTQLCKAFQEGSCGNPDCSFAHGEQELRTDAFFKKSLCTWNEKGKCSNGSRCRFAHGIDDLRSSGQPNYKTALDELLKGDGIADLRPSGQTNYKTQVHACQTAFDALMLKGDGSANLHSSVQSQTDYKTALDELLKGVPREHSIKADAGDRQGPGGYILAPANGDPMKVALPREPSAQYSKALEEVPPCKFFGTTELASRQQANLDSNRLKTLSELGQQIAPMRKAPMHKVFDTTELASKQQANPSMNRLKEISDLREQIALIGSCCKLLQGQISQSKAQNIGQISLQRGVIAPPPGLSQDAHALPYAPHSECSKIDLPANMIPEILQNLTMRGGRRGSEQSTWCC